MVHREPDTDPLLIPARERSIDGFAVGRVLPAQVHRSVGPFVFFDHMGPASLAAGQGLDVRPHPHIGLSTVTYLFEGAIFHRDSLGSALAIRPGAINWMTAGRGIVHSERTPPVERADGPRLHGLQLWVALPKSCEECEPSFAHHASDTIPELDEPGVSLRILAGAAYGKRAPVEVASPLHYVEVRLQPGAEVALPPEHAERAAYLVEGDATLDGTTLAPRAMAVVGIGTRVLASERGAHLVLVGGDPLDAPRYVFWNFVSSSKERIEEAARDWREHRFPLVPGDSEERIPLDLDPQFTHSH